MKQNQHKVGSFDHNYDIKKVLRASRILNFAFSLFSLKVKKLLNGTLDRTSPQFYPGIYVTLVTLLTYPVSTRAAKCIFNGMKRLKTPLRSTMSQERQSSLAILEHTSTRIWILTYFLVVTTFTV